MKRRLVAASVVALALGAAPASAGPATQPVAIEFQSFAPEQLDALPGDIVQWSNTSVRVHTVSANDGSFDSGNLSGGGGRFVHEFDAPGVYLYHCSIHLGMTGEVDVRRVTLDPLSAGPATGQRVTFTGRTADGSAAVNVQEAASGGYSTVASATPASDGRWSVTLTAASTGDYRASSGADISQTRRLLVVNQRVFVRASGQGVAVTVTPPDPGATVVLETLPA